VGTLYVVGTPIGNLEDITLRALRVLRRVDIIAAEDTRRARILAERYQVERPVTSYFEGNKREKMDAVLGALVDGDVALISDAGMPGLSDPGYELVCAAIECGFAVVPVPGPTSSVTALVVSGLPTDRFHFAGFLPRRGSERRSMLAQVEDLQSTLIFFEAPHRLRASLADIEAILGDRPIACCRELTKLHEEVWRGTVSGARAHFDETRPRGEFTLVVGPAREEQEKWTEDRVRKALGDLLAQGVARPDAAKRIAKESGWARSEVYDLGLSTE
jgi:16S rRNA (cytidine1402-2'-O)-methyltransferase